MATPKKDPVVEPKKKKVGRPTKYRPEYCREIVAFFDVPKRMKQLKSVTRKPDGTEKEEYDIVTNDLPTLAKFARKIGVNKDSLLEWAERHQEFSVALNDCKELQKELLVDNALHGIIPAAAYIFTAKNITDMKEFTALDVTSNGKTMTPEVHVYLPKRKEKA